MPIKIKTEPKDVFMHLLAMVTLYSSITAFLVLVFQYINVLIPDPLTGNYYQLQSYFNGIRISIASLIVIFPVFVWVNYFLNKMYKGEPSKRRFKNPQMAFKSYGFCRRFNYYRRFGGFNFQFFER